MGGLHACLAPMGHTLNYMALLLLLAAGISLWTEKVRQLCATHCVWDNGIAAGSCAAGNLDKGFWLWSAGPFSYVFCSAGVPMVLLVCCCRAGGTRTCIHTPSEPMRVDEMPAEAAACILEGAALVYFDGRLTEPALELARAARAKGEGASLEWVGRQG